MAAKKVGTLIKEARTNAGLTQQQLAQKIKGISASDISKAERGEKDLTQDVLKQIAKATGVTQASLINAAKASSSSSKKTTGTSMKVTATEKKLVELYRAANSDTKKAAMKLLKGEKTDAEDIIDSLLSGAVSLLGKKSNDKSLDTDNTEEDGDILQIIETD